MSSVDEIRYNLKALKISLKDIRGVFSIDDLEEKVAEMAKLSEDANFWDDHEKASELLKEKKSAESILKKYESAKSEMEDLELMLDLADEDVSFAEEADSAYDNLKDNLEKLKLNALLDGEHDKNNAILTIHGGSGGTEAKDWAGMLLRMYSRYAEKNGFKLKYLDRQDAEEGGINSATVLIIGENAYGYLKNEKGVHRLVRISPFDSQKRRHTSFASVDVMPEIEADTSIEISPDDIRIDTFRSSGAGGQHVNKTDSAIRITHLPTNIVVSCQNERSQHQNKEVAMKLLISKLVELKETEHKESLAELAGDYSQITWGSQIRSYVFQPYTLVKDHRTGKEIGNVIAVMDGEIDEFIVEKLKQR
jgi:peptide chain release factor 2